MPKFNVLRHRNKLVNLNKNKTVVPVNDYTKFEVVQVRSPGIYFEELDQVKESWDKGIKGYFINLGRKYHYSDGLPQVINNVKTNERANILHYSRAIDTFMVNMKWILKGVRGESKYRILFFGVSYIPGVETRIYIYISATKENFEFAKSILVPFENYIELMVRDTINGLRPFEIKYIRLTPQLDLIRPQIAFENGEILSNWQCDHTYIYSKQIIPPMNFYLYNFDMEGANVLAYDLILKEDICSLTVYIGAESELLWNKLKDSLRSTQTYSVLYQLLQIKDNHTYYKIKVNIKDIKYLLKQLEKDQDETDKVYKIPNEHWT